jgi:hypothetical protein
VPATAGEEYSSIPGEEAVSITGLTSAAEMVGSLPSAGGENDGFRLCSE